jgi:SAM-dependent methyltransferase
MINLFNRIGHLFTQILFSIIIPPLLIPSIVKLSITRLFISFCFGRVLVNKYQNIIDIYGGKYGLAMSEGLDKAKKMAGRNISFVVDSGTGTGFVTKQASEQFPNATFIAFDVVYEMLMQAHNNCKDIKSDIFNVLADNFNLPLADESADLVLAQNTIPCFSEFARVCRSGGIIIFVDTSGGWITNLAKWLVARHHLFETIIGERVDLGFYILAKKASQNK